MTDTINIENKAINCLRTYLEDSKTISSFIADNDKEPCWDGFLYLYNENNLNKNKKDLIGRIPVQIKGTEIDKFKIKDFKFYISKEDLKAYLTDPPIFIVCQELRNSKEKKLFYHFLLPQQIKQFLSASRNNSKVAVQMFLFPENLNDFEEMLLLFLKNKEKQGSFAHIDTPSIDEAMKRGINKFSFVTPPIKPGFDLLSYLSSHETYMYASSEFVDIPIEGGPMTIKFFMKKNEDISVNGKVFYHGYKNIIEDGKMIVNIGDALKITFKTEKEIVKTTDVKLSLNAIYLDECINEAEFAIALNKYNTLKIGDVDLKLKMEDCSEIEKIDKKLKVWRKLQTLLTKLNVTKKVIVNDIKPEQEELIKLLINSIVDGKTSKNTMRLESTLYSIEIGNIKVLVACLTNDKMCYFKDIFDSDITFSYRSNEQKRMATSCSYMLKYDLWKEHDNIPYHDIVKTYEKYAEHLEYKTVNSDILKLIQFYDDNRDKDEEKALNSLMLASDLNNWLKTRNNEGIQKDVNVINQYQIIKRQRELTSDEKQEIRDCIVQKDPYIQGGH